MKDLDYVKTRKDLEAALSTRPVWKDFNFSASGVSALLDILAYNSHRASYYAKMLLDESFVDSAHTLPAMLSHAKRLGHLARGKKAATLLATVEARFPLSSTIGAVVTVPRGARFKGANAANDTRVFTSITPQYLGEVAPTATHRVFRGSVLLHEGTFKSTHWVVGGAALNPLYTITDGGADTTTLEVSWRAPSTTVDVPVKPAGGPEDIGAEAFYAFRERLGATKLVVTAALPVGARLDAKWLSTQGVAGNGVKAITFATQAAQSPSDIASALSVTATLDSPSMGGSDEETVEDLRESIPAAWRLQRRAVTASDIAAVVKNLYADIAFVEAWGGEEDVPRRYGKTIICAIPRSARRLSLAGREEIRRLLAAYKLSGEDILFADADRIEVEAKVVVTTTGAVTADAIKSQAEAVVATYFKTASAEPLVSLSGRRLAEAFSSLQGVDAVYTELACTRQLSSPLALDFGVAVRLVEAKGATVEMTTTGFTASTVSPGASVKVALAVPEVRVPRRHYFAVVKTVVEVM